MIKLPPIINNFRIDVVPINKKNYLLLNKIHFYSNQKKFLKISSNKFLVRKKGGYNTYLLMCENIVLGYFSFHLNKKKNYLIINEIGIDTSFQRSGIGNQIFNIIFENVKVNEYFIIVDDKNINMVKLIKRHGFTLISGWYYKKLINNE